MKLKSADDKATKQRKVPGLETLVVQVSGQARLEAA